jgi:hypothetical protein
MIKRADVKMAHDAEDRNTQKVRLADIATMPYVPVRSVDIVHPDDVQLVEGRLILADPEKREQGQERHHLQASTFSEALLELLNAKGMSNADAYKGANIDRKLFSKMLSRKDYHPSKESVLALCIGLRLDTQEAIEFLKTAGVIFVPTNVTDCVVLEHIKRGCYRINDINIELYGLGQEPLGYKSRQDGENE